MSEPTVTILVVDENAVDRDAVQFVLGHTDASYDLHVVGSLREGHERLEHHRFDLAIIDYELEDGHAVDLLARTGGMPVILISEVEDCPAARGVLHGVASDCLVKDANGEYLAALPAAVEGALARRRAQLADTETYRRPDLAG
jgi:DNA-binding NtrC family response regulator